MGLNVDRWSDRDGAEGEEGVEGGGRRKVGEGLGEWRENEPERKSMIRTGYGEPKRGGEFSQELLQQRRFPRAGRPGQDNEARCAWRSLVRAREFVGQRRRCERM